MIHLKLRAMCLVVLFGLPALGADTPAAKSQFSLASPQPESTRRMVERLAALDRDADPLAIPFFADKAVRFFQAKIAATTAPAELLALQLPYAGALLNNGQSEDALKEMEKYEQMLQASGRSPPPEEERLLLLNKAICSLRLGEQENCLANHNADSCLLPIQGGGIHKLPRGSRLAVKYLTELLKRAPTPYAAWLYNIAYMTLGGYPEHVPERWLIPPEVFASEYDIKYFPDVAGIVGVDVDEMSGGVVMDDFDNDGWLDVMTSGSGLHSQLRCFHNNGNGTFAEITDSAGLTGLTGGLNIIQGDYNNDGLIDILVLRGGWLGGNGRHPHSLLRNNGDNTFRDVTEEAGLLTFHPTQSAVWFDYDGDGWLDIFVANETVAGSGVVDPCELFHNNRDGTFTECAAASGVAVVDWVKAVVTADYNNDGRPDLYLSSLVGPNRLLRNDGPANPGAPSGTSWRFTDTALAAGVQAQQRSFSCMFFDYDNDGWSDLFVTGYRIQDAGDILMDYLGKQAPGAERARLFHNNRDGTFATVTSQAGLDRILHGMGLNFGDLDNDGWLDFYVGTGDPLLGTLIPNLMFRNNGAGYFQDVTTSGGFGQLQKGHGIAFGDVNHDGTQDIYSHLGGALTGDHYPSQLFANPGHGNHWLKLKLEGVRSNRPALGARVKVVAHTDSGPREIHRTVGSGANFGASPLRQEIGLGDATAIDRVEIFWPATGKTQVIKGLKLDRCYAIREDANVAKEIALSSFAWPKATENPGHHHHAGSP